MVQTRPQDMRAGIQRLATVVEAELGQSPAGAVTANLNTTSSTVFFFPPSHTDTFSLVYYRENPL